MSPEEFASMLGGLGQKIMSSDFSESFNEVVPIVHDSVEQNFARQVDEDGVAWPPRKDDLPHPLLILTTAMMTAATGGEGAIVDVQKDSVGFGIDKPTVPYKNVHQYGYGNIPRRQYFYVHNEDREKLVSKFGVVTSKIVKRVMGRG